MEQHINAEHFRIPREVLEARIDHPLNARYEDYEAIVPLRDIRNIEFVELLPQRLLERLIQSIPLREDQTRFPYSESRVQLFSREPRSVLLSQRFVMQDKLLALMDSFHEEGMFCGFATKGISHMPPSKVYGRNAQENKVFALYLPPIIEQRDEGEILLDGTHRSYICRSVGTSVYAIHVNNVSAAYPTQPVSWRECQIYQEKPDVSVRYNGLDKRLFRDLNYIGIDA